MHRVNKKSGFSWILSGLLLIAAALLLITYNLWNEATAAASSNIALQQMLAILKNNGVLSEQSADATTASGQAIDSGQTTVPGNTGSPADSSLTDVTASLPDYYLNPEMEMPTTEIDGRDYIGFLDIPSLELSLPIISRWSYPDLKVSPCRYAGSAYLDNLVIAAHNYRTHFGYIKNLRPGDKLTFTDVDGNIFYYEVADIEILKPTDTQKMVSGDYALTLFTCTYGGQSRITVGCDVEDSASLLHK